MTYELINRRYILGKGTEFVGVCTMLIRYPVTTHIHIWLEQNTFCMVGIFSTSLIS